ncbi:diguanylate cyclase (GGDEF) domain-containing protein [Ruminococcaceae bacterium YAD3003]|nr:diguanylate cyclase (GGDEF) domain-containing protein [Ruminococcaceae bacterium YAD3003]
MKICAFVGDLYRDYSAGIIRTLRQRALERGHHVDVYGNCSVPSSNSLHATGLKSVLSLPDVTDYDGIILCSDTLTQGGMSKELINNLTSMQDLPPVISIRAADEGFYNIVPDNRQIMYDISKYVISKCKTSDIGFVTGRDDLVDAQERLAGFEDAMKEAGYEIREDMIFHGNYWVTQGPQTADFFIREDGTLPEAIICSNDYMALTLMDELTYRGYKLPNDTLITGVDDIDAASSHIPSLTTSDIPEETLADSALETLEKILNNEDVDFYINVPGKLILRESTNDSEEKRDVIDAYKKLDIMKKTAFDVTRAFVILSSLYEDSITPESYHQITMENLLALELFRKAYLCYFRENDRSVFGYFQEDGEIHLCDIGFPSDQLLPDEFIDTDSGIRIFLPIYYKNEVYGYGAFEVLPDTMEIVSEKLEFILLLLGQTINRTSLYNKLFAVSDVMDMYVRDALTGLFNRRGFEKNIAGYFDSSRKMTTPLAVASIDMDGLKHINDTFGHSSGDEAIKAISCCIKAAVNKNEFAARMGGDEFEVVLVLDSPGRVGQFIRTLRKLIKEANSGHDWPYVLSASIGTCELTGWEDLLECMNKADKAMYLEKKTKKSRVS